MMKIWNGGDQMEEQEYVIKGTVEGIIKVLRSDFDMQLGEVRFFVYNMLTQHNRDIDGFSFQL